MKLLECSVFKNLSKYIDVLRISRDVNVSQDRTLRYFCR